MDWSQHLEELQRNLQTDNYTQLLSKEPKIRLVHPKMVGTVTHLNLAQESLKEQKKFYSVHRNGCTNSEQDRNASEGMRYISCPFHKKKVIY